MWIPRHVGSENSEMLVADEHKLPCLSGVWVSFK